MYQWNFQLFFSRSDVLKSWFTPIFMWYFERTMWGHLWVIDLPVLKIHVTQKSPDMRISQLFDPCLAFNVTFLNWNRGKNILYFLSCALIADVKHYATLGISTLPSTYLGFFGHAGGILFEHYLGVSSYRETLFGSLWMVIVFIASVVHLPEQHQFLY